MRNKREKSFESSDSKRDSLEDQLRAWTKACRQADQAAFFAGTDSNIKGWNRSENEAVKSLAKWYEYCLDRQPKEDKKDTKKRVRFRL